MTGDIKIAPTDLSIAEYDTLTDTIKLWGWNDPEVVDWYRHPNETFIEQVVRTVAHEEFHRILYFVEGYSATWHYDFITTTRINDLP